MAKLSNVQQLMKGRAPGDMPSPQDFHTAMSRDYSPPDWSHRRIMVVVMAWAVIIIVCAMNLP